MCGIFGISFKKKPVDWPDLTKVIEDLFVLSSSRGKEASGVVVKNESEIRVLKSPLMSGKFIQTPSYKKLMARINENKPTAIIGHSRLATNGLQVDNKNNQPIITKNIVGVHNGIVVNDELLWREKVKAKPKTEVDSEALFSLVDQEFEKGEGVVSAVRKTYQLIEGSASIGFFHKKLDPMILVTNTGSLYWMENRKENWMIFASERFILTELIDRNDLKEIEIYHLYSGEGLIVGGRVSKNKKFNLKKSGRLQKIEQLSSPLIIKNITNNEVAEARVLNLYSKSNVLKRIQKHDFDYGAIKKIRRCAECVLPETFPFIDFDEKGVCNYCKNHNKIEYTGKIALEKMVEPYRRSDGEPDCIIAFSGGRDSSYGLHYLKKELGMNPIAYTYDWGMVTDVARRNEARMVGKLGVEHVIVSADITMKRDHIRKHIKAWMKKPDLGMVPLFMEGDKQCEYYADDLARKNNIELIFYCRGNELENEEFKWGHCGIKNATPKGVIHNLSLEGKVRIAAYYGWQYLTNPSYINSSIFDTMLAYYSTYVQRHDYVFLWHYIPWEEEEIVKTLVDGYGWEVNRETKATWRTDDGTSAFYNYIYYCLQGFTENDTFRSNQIREGLISRKEALRVVNHENRPRYRDLQWYFDKVGLDGDVVLSVVDQAKRLY